MKKDIFEDLGYLAIASRMKKISDYLYEEVAQLYKNSGLNLDSRFFPIISVLSRQEELSVQEISKQLGLTHAAVSILAKALIGKKMVVSREDAADRRRTLLSLSLSAKATTQKAAPIWKQIEATLKEYGSTSKGDLLEALSEFEKRLMTTGLTPLKNADERNNSSLGITEYKANNHKDFEKINREWLKENGFRVEPIDVQYFKDPKKTILDKGGLILFAQFQSKNVGTCALVPLKNGEVELLKMGVLKKMRGKGIGTFLLKNTLDRARRLGFKSVVLETHSSLKSACALYKSFGFKEIPCDASAYTRVDTKMKLRL